MQPHHSYPEKSSIIYLLCGSNQAKSHLRYHFFEEATLLSNHQNTNLDRVKSKDLLNRSQDRKNQNFPYRLDKNSQNHIGHLKF
ncbi:unnamed protein product [Blepharisma stoltei]|uniref:Uncharacterized protein n=1 Tax=Blepharisma stoltei TaxID=1481888 RepID=A0AAU9KDV1_9CILI|nr:unnamed protein product [Blepharisma stoltei]